MASALFWFPVGSVSNTVWYAYSTSDFFGKGIVLILIGG